MSDNTDTSDASKDDIVKEALEAFELCEEREEHNREEALDDLRFARLNKQWPEKELLLRQAEGRPALSVNKLPAYIRQVVNDVRKNTPSVMVHPVDSNADPKTAEVISGLIRNIETTSDADIAYDTAGDYAASCGFGYIRVNIEYADDDTFDKDIKIKRIANPFSVWGDPHDLGADSANWNIAFVGDRMTRKQFQAKYKGAADTNFDGVTWKGLQSPWIDGDDIQIAEYWKRTEQPRTICLLSDGTVMADDVYAEQKDFIDSLGIQCIGERQVKSHKVTQYILNGVETLDKVDWCGKFIPLVPVYGEDIVVDGKRYLRSLIRDAKDSQQMVNYWRTTATELVALAPKAPWIGPTGAFDDDPRWETANSESHAYLEYKGNVAPQRLAFAGVPAGALQEALNASDDMKAIIGLYDASLGAQGNETSGRAIMARQQQGDTSNFHFVDNLARAVRHVGRICVDLIPHVIVTPRIVRILGQDGQPQSVPVNQPVILRDGQPPQPAPEPAIPGMDPEVPDGALLHVYDLTAGKYDITVETGPSFTTQREEAANQMMELLRTFPQAAPVIGDLVAKNLDWPGADEIAKRLQVLQQSLHPGLAPGGQGGAPGQPGQPGQPQPGAIPPQVMAAIQQLQQQVVALSQQNQALQQDHTVAQQDSATKQFDAQTKRLKVLVDAQKPSHLPQQASMALH